MSVHEEIKTLEKRVKEITRDYRINIKDLDEYRESQDRIKALRAMLINVHHRGGHVVHLLWVDFTLQQLQTLIPPRFA